MRTVCTVVNCVFQFRIRYFSLGKFTYDVLRRSHDEYIITTKTELLDYQIYTSAFSIATQMDSLISTDEVTPLDLLSSIPSGFVTCHNVTCFNFFLSFDFYSICGSDLIAYIILPYLTNEDIAILINSDESFRDAILYCHVTKPDGIDDKRSSGVTSSVEIKESICVAIENADV